jgi:hypothetical protein
MVREQISENLSPKRAKYSVTVAQHSNMGFLGNIFAKFSEKQIPFLLAWRT